MKSNRKILQLPQKQQRAQLDRLMDKAFLDRLNEGVLTIGTTTLNAREFIGQVGVPNLVAARKLTKVLKELNIKTIKELFNLGAIPLLRVKGVGNAQMWVAMHLLDSHAYDVLKWWGWTNVQPPPKFSTYRHHARERVKKEGSHEL